MQFALLFKIYLFQIIFSKLFLWRVRHIDHDLVRLAEDVLALVRVRFPVFFHLTFFVMVVFQGSFGPLILVILLVAQPLRPGRQFD